MEKQEQLGVNPAGVNPENNNADNQQPIPREGENAGQGKSGQVDLGQIVQALNQFNEKIDKQVIRRIDGLTKDFVDVRHKVNEFSQKSTTPQDDYQENYDSPEAIVLKREKEDSDDFIEQAIKDFQSKNPDYADSDEMNDLLNRYYRRENANRLGNYRSKEAVMADYERAKHLRELDKKPMNNQSQNAGSYGAGDTTPSTTPGFGTVSPEKKTPLNLDPLQQQLLIEQWGSIANYEKAVIDFNKNKIDEGKGFQRLQER